MSNKEFYKRFEEILKEIFGEKNESTKPKENFVDNVKFDTFTDELGEWKRTIRTSRDGLFTSIQCVLDNGKKWSAPEKNDIKDLKRRLDLCVKNQEFEEAVKLRDKIRLMESENTKISQLKKEMEIAIQEQNFERAIEIRDELKQIN